MPRRYEYKDFEAFYRRYSNERYSRSLGKIYRTTKKLMEQECSPEMIRERENNKDYNEMVTAYIDRQMPKYDETTQLIIRKEFLEESPAGWYEAYFKERKFQRLKEKAAEQFAHVLTADQ